MDAQQKCHPNSLHKRYVGPAGALLAQWPRQRVTEDLGLLSRAKVASQPKQKYYDCVDAVNLLDRDERNSSCNQRGNHGSPLIAACDSHLESICHQQPRSSSSLTRDQRKTCKTVPDPARVVLCLGIIRPRHMLACAHMPVCSHRSRSIGGSVSLHICP